MSDEAREAARQLIETVPGLMQAVTSEMRHSDAPMAMPHFRTLMMIGKRGSCTLTDIAQRQLVSLPTMSNTISVLVDRGWVERTADAQDRRRTDLRLTDDGKRAVGDIYSRVERLLADRLSTVQPHELEELKAGLSVLRRAFGAHPHPDCGGES